VWRNCSIGSGGMIRAIEDLLRERLGGFSSTVYMASVGEGHLQELRDEISNLVHAIAHDALQSNPALVDCLAQAREMRILRPLEFYEQFVTMISSTQLSRLFISLGKFERAARYHDGGRIIFPQCRNPYGRRC
jgi:RNase P/RNase MRP subunit p30